MNHMLCLSYAPWWFHSFKLQSANFPFKYKRYCFHVLPAEIVQIILQHGIHNGLEFQWHNDLETCHLWIWIASACVLDNCHFTRSLSHANDKKTKHEWYALLSYAPWWCRGSWGRWVASCSAAAACAWRAPCPAAGFPPWWPPPDRSQRQ